MPLEINFSILLDSGLIFQDCHEDVLKVLPHWKSLIPHSFGDLPALIFKEHTDHDGEYINLKKIYFLYYVCLFPYFPVCSDETYNYLHTASCGFCFAKLLNQSYLKLSVFFFFFLLVYLDFAVSICSSRLRYEWILISFTIWFLSEVSRCPSKFAVMCLTLFSTHSLISALNLSFFSSRNLCQFP